MNKILYDKETDIDLVWNMKIIQMLFATSNSEEIRVGWLVADDDGVGYHNLTEEDIRLSNASSEKEVGDDSDNEEDNDNVPKLTHSRNLDDEGSKKCVNKLMKTIQQNKEVYNLNIL